MAGNGERRELIFNYGDDLIDFNEGDLSNQRVDLEIVLLGPKSKRSDKHRQRKHYIQRLRQHNSKSNPSRGSGSSKEDNDDDDDNSKRTNSDLEQSLKNPVERDGLRSLKSTDSLDNGAQDDDKSGRQLNEPDKKESRKRKSPKQLERLLERMERKYKETKEESNGLKKEDDLYVDYLDYF